MNRIRERVNIFLGIQQKKGVSMMPNDIAQLYERLQQVDQLADQLRAYADKLGDSRFAVRIENGSSLVRNYLRKRIAESRYHSRNASVE